jgi:hypothetical protein
MNLLSIVAALAVIFCVGYGATRWLLKGVGPLWGIEVVGFSWLFGSGLVSLLLAIGGMVLSGPMLVIAVTAFSLMLGVSAWLPKAGVNVMIQRFPAGAKRWEVALSLLPLLPIAWLTMQGFRETMHWDGILVWEIKARLAFLNDGAVPRSYFSDQRMLWSHPNYPLYLPMLDLWMYLWLGETHQFWVKALFPVFYLAAAGVLWSAGFRLTGQVWIGAVAALLLFVVPRVVTARAGVLQGYADLPLAIVYLAAFGALLLSAEKNRTWLRVAAAASALLPWVKQEGSVLWACFALTAVWLWRREWRVAVALVLPGLLMLLAWRTFLGMVEATHAATFQPFTLETLRANLPRVLPLLRRFGEELVRIHSWSLLWPLAAVAMVSLALRRNRSAIPLALALIVPLCLYLVPYVFTALQPWEMHVETSIDRLVLQLVPVAVLGLALVLADEENSKHQIPNSK